ncbi:MAG: single-stranded DNA-binding protein [Chloroflexota bacterium]
MYQQLIIVGNLGRDPEMRYTPSGQAVTSFNVATNRQYTGSDGNQVKEVTWFRISVWGKQAETCSQYLKKGSKVLIEGRLTGDPVTGGPKIWTRQDGTPGASFDVTANSVRFLSSRGEDGGMGSGDSFGAQQGGGGEDGDNIPF